MRLWLVRIGLGAGLLILSLYLWRFAFPSPEHVIRKQLSALARLACIAPDEASLVKLAKSQRLASFFTRDAEVTVDFPGRFPQSITGRDELMQVALTARTGLKKLKVEFLDLEVKVGPDGQSGDAHFTVKADVPGEGTPQVEELEAHLLRVDGEWLIQHVQNVRTLR